MQAVDVVSQSSGDINSSTRNTPPVATFEDNGLHVVTNLNALQFSHVRQTIDPIDAFIARFAQRFSKSKYQCDGPCGGIFQIFLIV